MRGPPRRASVRRRRRSRPPGPNPVEVLTKSAPASCASRQASASRSSLSSAVSRITLTIAPAAMRTLTTTRMMSDADGAVLATSQSAPMFSTMSISLAPASNGSLRLPPPWSKVRLAPSGNPTTVQTFTLRPPQCLRYGGSPVRIHANAGEADSSRASPQTCRMSARVASGRSRVWSILLGQISRISSH